MKTLSFSVFLPAMVLCAAFMSPAHAQSDVYVCMNGDGTREYKNTGETKGCKRVDMQGVSMIPSPYKKPVVQTAAFNRPAGTASGAASPADFPKIDSTTQKARDTDRMQILTEEMKVEERKLAALKQDFNNGEPERRGDERNFAKYQDRVASMKDDVSRTEKNIEALKREIGNLK
jgi:anti-sigma28 factor (negative regulator of flagellin synthesis)